MSQDIELFAPEFALEEINKYKNDIIKRNKLTIKEFEQIKLDVAIAVKFIPLEEYSQFLKKALKMCPDPNDIDFFALSIKLNLPIWSNDSRLKNQKEIEIISTRELITKPEIIKILDKT
jgi:predicted nucleic acid-binding protein